MTAAPVLKIHRSVTKALKLFDADRLRWLDEAAAAAPIAVLQMGPIRTWVVTDPDSARNMLVTDSPSWTRPPAARVPVRLGVGENLFTQTDRAWRTFQPLVAPTFRKKVLDGRVADLDALVADEVGTIPKDTTIDLELAMGRIALCVAAWVLLGERLDAARAEEIARHQREVVQWVGVQLGALTGFLPVAVGRRARVMRQHRRALDAYVDEVIDRARTTRGDDLLGALLGARVSGRALTSVELRGHVLGLFLAGNETTAAALSWALVHAAHEPGERTRVRSDPQSSAEPFLTEMLRLTPAVWGIPRTPTRSGVTLSAAGITERIRRSELATVYLRAINRDPTIWSDPLRFDPSRHRADTKDQVRTLFPFGLGPRGRIGQHLAMAELRAALPALARLGDVTIDEPTVEDASFALRVRGGLRGRFTAPKEGRAAG